MLTVTPGLRSSWPRDARREPHGGEGRRVMTPAGRRALSVGVRGVGRLLHGCDLIEEPPHGSCELVQGTFLTDVERAVALETLGLDIVGQDLEGRKEGTNVCLLGRALGRLAQLPESCKLAGGHAGGSFEKESRQAPFEMAQDRRHRPPVIFR